MTGPEELVRQVVVTQEETAGPDGLRGVRLEPAMVVVYGKVEELTGAEAARLAAALARAALLVELVNGGGDR